MSGIKVVWGAASVVPGSAFGTQERWDETAKILKEGGVDTLDTATLYKESASSFHAYSRLC